MENTKRDLSLDFTKPRYPRGGQPAPSLVTPILNLSTPELNKMISEEELAVLTPNGISSVIPQSNVLPSPLIPTTVNSNNIIQHGNINSNSNNHHLHNGNNNINNSNTNNGNHHNNHSNNKRSDKNRDLDVEKIKKKRERNRIAAKKCRQRKQDTIDELKKTVAERDQEIQRLNIERETLTRERQRIEMELRKEIDIWARKFGELKNSIHQ